MELNPKRICSILSLETILAKPLKIYEVEWKKKNLEQKSQSSAKWVVCGSITFSLPTTMTKGATPIFWGIISNKRIFSPHIKLDIPQDAWHMRFIVAKSSYKKPNAR